jgi:hypothetical protein
MNSKPFPDPWDVILDLLQQLPPANRRALADALRQVLSQARPRPDVRADARTAEAYGIAYPATVEIRPATLRLLPGRVVPLAGSLEAVAEFTGDLTVTPAPSPGPPTPFRQRQDRFIAGIVVAAVIWASLNFSTQPLDQAVRELLSQLIELLLFGYPRR